MSDHPEPARRDKASPATHIPALSGTDDAVLRHVLGHFPTGVAVVTAMAEQGPVGMAMNSFTSVSLDPPLVLFCPALSSRTWPKLRESGGIAINVLSAGQESVSRQFSGPELDRFGGTEWSAGDNGAPLLSEALGWLECSVRAEHPAGDHTVVIAEIERLGVHREISEPLMFFRGDYYAGISIAVETAEGV